MSMADFPPPTISTFRSLHFSLKSWNWVLCIIGPLKDSMSGNEGMLGFENIPFAIIKKS